MALEKTQNDLQLVDAMDSSLTLSELSTLSAGNPHAQFLTKYGVLLNGSIVADKTNVVSTAATPNTVAGRDEAGDVYMRGIVDANGHLYALPLSDMADSGDADCVLQEKITDLSTIRSNAAKGATAVQKSGDTMTGNLTVPTVVGDLEGTADYAKELTGHIETTEEEFNFRASAGDKSIRDESAVIRSVKGNSVVWNQLITNGNFADNPASDALPTGWINGLYYITLRATISYPSEGGIKFICDKGAYTVNTSMKLSNFVGMVSGHKYLWSCDYSLILSEEEQYPNESVALGGSTGNRYRLYLPNTEGVKKHYEKIMTPTVNIDNFQIQFVRGIDGGEELWINNIRIHDLTQMFGVGNEPTTVEEFYQRIPVGVDINAYNEGEIIDLVPESIKTTGFNQFNGEYAQVIGGETYYFSGTYTSLRFTTEEGGTTEEITLTDNKYTPTQNGYIYASGTDICINLSHTGYRDGEYEEYKEHNLDISWVKKYFPNGMRSAGSAKDELRFNNTTQKWEAVQNVGVVDLGSLSWNYPNPDKYVGIFIVSLSLKAKGHNCKSILNLGTKDFVLSEYSSFSDNTLYFHSENTVLYAKFSSYTDAASFKAAMSGVMLNYELAEPIVTEITDVVDMTYNVYDFGTEELLVADGDKSSPFSGEVVYQFNAVDRIRDAERNINVLKDNISDIDTIRDGAALGATAVQPNGTSSQFVKGDGSLDAPFVALSVTAPAQNGSATATINSAVYDEIVAAKVVQFQVDSHLTITATGCFKVSGTARRYSAIAFTELGWEVWQFYFVASTTSSAVTVTISRSDLANAMTATVND